MKLRTAGGLGDALYIRALLRYINKKDVFISNGHRSMFDDMDVIRWTGFKEEANTEDINCQYVHRRDMIETNQFEDTFILSGVKYDDIPPFNLDMDLSKHHIPIDTKFKKLCLVKLPSYRSTGDIVKNKDMQPDIRLFQSMIDSTKDIYYYVSVGSESDKVDSIKGIDCDLTGKTTEKQLLWLASKSDMILTQCGHMLPIAESLDKKVFVLFSHKSINSDNYITRTATPSKVITKGHVAYAYDNEEGIIDKWLLYANESVYKNQATDLQLSNFIRGKNVVILGSSPSVLNNNASHIHSFDTICRVNGTDADTYRYQKQIGTRTDIHYSFYGSSIARSADALKKEGCKMLVSKIPYCNFTEHYTYGDEERRGVLNFNKYFDNFRFSGIRLYLPHTWDLIEECKIVNRMLTSGVSGIRKILSYHPKQLYITGFDFFESKTHNVSQPWKNGNGGHKTESEREYVKKLYNENKNVIIIDDTLKKIFDR